MLSSFFFFAKYLLRDCKIIYFTLSSKNMRTKVVKVSFLDTKNETFSFLLADTKTSK